MDWIFGFGGILQVPGPSGIVAGDMANDSLFPSTVFVHGFGGLQDEEAFSSLPGNFPWLIDAVVGDIIKILVYILDLTKHTSGIPVVHKLVWWVEWIRRLLWLHVLL